MQEHYQKECLRQFHRVIGSVEVLGNPVGLMRNLGTGMQAFRSGLTGLRNGDRQSFKDGAKAFAKHGAHGLSNTISKVSSSLSRGLASAAMDDDFVKEREATKDFKVRPETAKVGFQKGTSTLMKSFSSGFSGLYKKPMEGYVAGGYQGLAEGVGVGIAGLLCKPTSGLMDLVANTSEGLKNYADPLGKVELHRYRDPRRFEHDGVLRPLRAVLLPHMELLERLATYAGSLPALGGDLKIDVYRSHIALVEGIVLFTDKHCIYTQYNSPDQSNFSEPGVNAQLSADQVKSCVLAWHVHWEDLGGVRMEGENLILQADPTACATWDTVSMACQSNMQEQVYQLVHDSWSYGVEEFEEIVT